MQILAQVFWAGPETASWQVPTPCWCCSPDHPLAGKVSEALLGFLFQISGTLIRLADRVVLTKIYSKVNPSEKKNLKILLVFPTWNKEFLYLLEACSVKPNVRSFSQKNASVFHSHGWPLVLSWAFGDWGPVSSLVPCVLALSSSPSLFRSHQPPPRSLPLMTGLWHGASPQTLVHTKLPQKQSALHTLF